MHTEKRHFIPAAGLHAALPLYDPLLKLMGASEVQAAFVDGAALQSGQRVLEIGCGTGNVAILAKQHCPGAEVVGLDPDTRALTRARAKASRAGLAVRFDEGYSDALPYADASFDVVLSSFMWHHLPAGVQQASLSELRRVLSADGSVHILDFARPSRRSARAHGQAADELCASLERAGFVDVQAKPLRRVLLMHVHRFRARVPADA